MENLGQTGVVEPAAAGLETPGVTAVTPADGQQAATPAAGDLQSQIDAFKTKALDETQKRQALESELQQIRDQMAFVAANSQTQQQAQQQVQKSMFEQAIEDLGYEKDSYLTVEEQAKVNTLVEQRQIAHNTAVAQNQSFLSQHPDFAEVVGTGNPANGTFVPSPHLQKLVQKNPQLAQAIANSPQAAQLAYHFVVSDPDYIAAKQTQSLTPEQKAAQAAANAIKAAARPISISAAMGGGGNMSKAQQITSMTDAEFAAYKERLKAGVV
jgi:hypothetical protein